MSYKHPSWRRLSDLIGEISTKYDGQYYDKEDGLQWMDPGQLLCRIVYGKGWPFSGKFREDNDSEVCPNYLIEKGEAVLRDGLPDYIQFVPSTPAPLASRKEGEAK